MKDFNRFRFGVNYVPTRNWYYMWNDFEADAIARDLDAIAAIHADHIRLQTVWPWFMPNQTYVSEAHLGRLVNVMELAGERNIDVCVCALDGHLSGLQFVPGYRVAEGFLNSPGFPREVFFTSSQMRELQVFYFSALAEALRDCDNFLGFDLGNELNCCWSTSDRAAGDEWFSAMLSLVDELAPGKVHVNGVDHQPWFRETTFSPEALAKRQDIISLHTWIRFTGALDRGGPLDPCCTQLAAGCAKLAKAYAGDLNKPVWIQEFGASAEWMPEIAMPEFYEMTVRNAVDAGVCWFTWWCSHDIDAKFKFDTLEYDLGLIDVENNIKPHGETFRRLADEFRSEQPRQLSGACLLPPDELNHEATWAWLEASFEQTD